MNRIKCPQCGLVNRVDAPACLRCKTAFIEAESDTEDSSTVSFDDLSETFDYTSDRSSSLWTRIVEQRYRLALVIGVVVVAFLLNQTQLVSSWFVPKDIAAILQDLDERTEKAKSASLLAKRDRLKTVAIHASRGRRNAITELINLTVESGMEVPHPSTQGPEAQERKLAESYQRAFGPQSINGVRVSNYEAESARQHAYDPGRRSDYSKRSAWIEEYAGDILAHIGEPAVEPIMARIKAIKNAQQAGDTTYDATMPRELLYALGQIKSPKALELLIECASAKPYSYNNVVVIEALSFYENDDPRLVQIYDTALKEAAADEQSPFNRPYAIRVASDGLAQIKSRTSLDVLLTHLDVEKRGGKYCSVVQAIARIGKTAVPAVLEVLNSNASTKAKQNAVGVLGIMKASEARSEVVALLDSPDLHEQAAEALVAWNKIETIPDLEAAKQRHPEWGWDFDQAIQSIKR